MEISPKKVDATLALRVRQPLKELDAYNRMPYGAWRVKRRVLDSSAHQCKFLDKAAKCRELFAVRVVPGPDTTLQTRNDPEGERLGELHIVVIVVAIETNTVRSNPV